MWVCLCVLSSRFPTKKLPIDPDNVATHPWKNQLHRHNLNLDTKKDGLETIFLSNSAILDISGVLKGHLTSNLHTMLNPLEYLGGLIVFDQPQNVGPNFDIIKKSSYSI